jgi:hypothetical protein
MRRRLGRLVLVAALAGASTAVAGDLAVVVNPRNPVSGLSASELRDVVLLEQQHWRGGGRIYLLLPETGTAEKNLLLRRALKMNDEQLRRLYLSKLYGGDIPAFPRTVTSASRSRLLLARAVNALGFVDASAVDGSLKVLAIDGRRPGDAGYLLAAPR